MADILQYLEIQAPTAKVFKAISSPEGLNAWWTKKAQGQPVLGGSYQFWFAEEYDWRGDVIAVEVNQSIQWEIVKADADWTGTLLGFDLQQEGNQTRVEFYHRNWPEANLHYRRSCYCWAMYLRILKRYVELGEEVPYEQRTQG